MLETTLTSKGQITLPKALRDKLHLSHGDKLIFEEGEDGTITMRPYKKYAIKDLQGCLEYKGPAASLEEMDEAIAQYLSEQDEQSKT